MLNTQKRESEEIKTLAREILLDGGARGSF